MRICGKTAVKIPKCDECSELESRVQALEDDTCCEDTRAIVDEHTEQLGTIDNEILIIQETIDSIEGMHTEIVNELPEVGEPNVIYLVGCVPPEVGDAIVGDAVLCEGDNTYTMWIYSDNGWAQIGGGEIDLSNYVTFSELDEMGFLTLEDLPIYDGTVV